MLLGLCFERKRVNPEGMAPNVASLRSISSTLSLSLSLSHSLEAVEAVEA